ncbi:MAG: xanthine dehydrogenase family protein molybdopterin-binding subunit [Syntrophorhabdaceae bacterium]|nr:xanthine dehydrogenase family protein molybdopterin-binding subunit [Syntrophorhabdaceae bacterium]
MKRESLIGKDIPRIDSPEKALGRAKFAADIVLPGMLYAKVVRSPYAHARILNIDTSKAASLPGVKAVVTGIEDTPRGGLFGIVSYTKDQVLLPYDKVRYYGEEVAAVAAIDEDTAEEAAELIKVDYEPLPFVLNVEDALKEGAPLVHEDKPGNIAARYLVNEGNVEEAFINSDYVWEKTFTCEVASHALPEPYTAIASYEPSGKMNLWMQTQCPFQTRQALSNTLKLPLSDIRIHSIPMGGGHGGRSDTFPAAFIACLLSKKTGRPVQVKLSREEIEDCMRDKASKIWHIKVGFKKDGTITARDIKMTLECGAYASSSIVELWVPLLIDEVLWRTESYRYFGELVYTNKTISSMMRTRAHVGPMSMEVCFEQAGEALGIDPVELRLKNALQTGEVSPTKSTITSSGLKDSIKIAVEKSGYREKKGRLGARRGIGLGSGNMQSMFYMGFRSGSTAFIKFNDDGSCTLFTGNCDLGQGNQTLFTQIVAEELGIDMKDVKLCYGDTELCYQDPGTYSMSATVVSGSAVRKAALDAKRRLLEVAGDLLDVSWEEVEMEGKEFSVRYRRGKGKTVSLKEVCRTAFKRGKPIFGFGDHRARVDYSDFNMDLNIPYSERTYGQKVAAYSYGTTVVELEVDCETGKIKIDRIWAVNDCGTVINPLLVKGNMHGQLNFMIGHGLYEMNRWDIRTGRKLTSDFRSYKVPTANEIPDIETYFVGKPDPNGPYGAKEGSLGFGCGLHGAIANAIHDATGVWLYDVPFTPERVLKALEERGIK